jgi:peptide/nickel transport system substrate-binding protein
MTKKLWISIAALVVGSGLLVASSLAGTASSRTSSGPAGHAVKKGGTLRLSKSTDIDYIDPALAYFTDSWGFEFVTTARLFSYPDKAGAPGTQVIPEVVKTYTVSKDGKTYTFHLKNTYRFQNGAPVTAQSYADALNRDANPKMQSPATAYMHEIVGADDVINGKASKISGVIVKGKYTLIIKLTTQLPDLLSRLTLPFYAPILPNTPIDPNGINNPAGSGPYYFASRDVNRQLVLKRNPYYKGPRSANVDQIVENIGASLQACQLETEQDSVDYCVDGIPPTSNKQEADKYGVNKSQFFVNQLLGTSYFALNHDRPAFKGANGTALAKAINYAIDRPALVRAGGYLSGKRTDQILPPAMTNHLSLYPIKGANPVKGKQLAAGHMPPGNSLTLYTSNRGARVVRAQVFQYDMKQIGIDVNVQQFARAVEHDKCGTRGEPFDVCDEGWIVDYPDGITFFKPLLYGPNIRDVNNDNESYYNNPKFNKAIEAASRLSGTARRNAWANLDIQMMTQDPPWAPFLTINQVDFISKSTGCYLFHPVFLIDYSTICKK